MGFSKNLHCIVQKLGSASVKVSAAASGSIGPRTSADDSQQMLLLRPTINCLSKDHRDPGIVKSS